MSASALRSCRWGPRATEDSAPSDWWSETRQDSCTRPTRHSRFRRVFPYCRPGWTARSGCRPESLPASWPCPTSRPSAHPVARIRTCPAAHGQTTAGTACRDSRSRNTAGRGRPCETPSPAARSRARARSDGGDRLRAGRSCPCCRCRRWAHQTGRMSDRTVNRRGNPRADPRCRPA